MGKKKKDDKKALKSAEEFVYNEYGLVFYMQFLLSLVLLFLSCLFLYGLNIVDGRIFIVLSPIIALILYVPICWLIFEVTCPLAVGLVFYLVARKNIQKTYEASLKYYIEDDNG